MRYEMERDRNHEGYHDPTASAAIRQADRREHQRERSKSAQCLTYVLAEIKSFNETVKGIKM